MESFQLTSLLCFFSSLLSLSLSDLPSSCLSDLINPFAGRCCTPHTFVLVEFTLGFGCDVPQFLDGGVRFEVERARQQWEPIRFYSPTLTEAESSLVHSDVPGTVHAQAFTDNSTFPFHFVNASEGPVKIREYLCGEEYANETVRFRWMQRYVPPSVENVSTWWLDDIKISRWDGARLSTIMENDFSEGNLSSYESYNIRAGLIEAPSCSSSDSALYFRNASPQDFPRRSLVISHFSLSCSGRNCPPPVPLMRDSECNVTSCGVESVKCSVGSFQECSTCPSGFSTTTPVEETPSNTSLVACLDEDECSLMTHNCSGVAECVNTFGSFYCSCPPGYTLSPEGNTCQDIDECNDSSLNNCSHSCNNIDGGFNCSCPSGYVLNDGVLCTIPRVAFDSSDYTVLEGEDITLEIILLDDITEPLTLAVRTEDISAISADDYRALDQNLTFQPGGNTSLTMIIQALPDDHAELVETFQVVLSQSTLGIEENTTVYITDSNDVLVEFDSTNYTTTEGEDLMFRIVKRTDSSREVTIVFSTSPGTANATSDYESVSSFSLIFHPGEMVHTVNVSTLNDSVLEREEEFTASLELAMEGGGSGVMLGRSVAMATILNDDEVKIGFSFPIYKVDEGEGVEVTVEMRGETAIDVVVNVATQDSTANATEDYTNINKTLTFSSSISVHNISINTTDDDIFEGNELFQLVLSQPQPANRGVTLSDTITTNVTIVDNDALTSAPPVTLGFEQSAYSKSKDHRPFSICVRVMEGQLEDQITISININKIEAKADQDNRSQSISPQLTLAPGQNVSCFPNVSLIDDDQSEKGGPERFQLSLQAPTSTPRGQSVIIDPSTVVVAIYDDDELLSELEGLEELSTSDPGRASERFSKLVDAILESGRILPPRVSMEILEASQELLQNIGMGGHRSSNSSVGTRILTTLDRFALRAYDEKSQPELKIKGLSLRVQEVSSSPSSATVVGIDQNGTMIQLPEEAFTNAGQTVRVASFIFSNLSNALTNQTDDAEVENARIGSPVISTALGCGRRGNKCPNKATNFSVPVRIVLPIMRQDDESTHVPNCNFLNIMDNVWSKEGCTTVETNDTSVVCECNHLTHFAILLSPNLNITGVHAVALQVIGYVGVSISLVCMVLTIVALLALKTLWGMRNYIHVNLCICLIIAQLIFVIGVDKTQNQSACSAIAVLLHYWFLAAFMWMLMEGVVLYVALVRVFVKKQRFYIAGFTIVSYGVPLLYMIITVPLGLVLDDEKGNYYGSRDACWLRYDTNFIWAFIIPVILIILANVGFFIMAVYIMYKHQRRSVHKAAIKKVKHWLKTSIALLFIMGITWIIGVLVFHEALLFVAYIFTIFVAFQGAVIFIMFILLSKQVRENYKKWWRGKVAESDILSNYFSSESSGGKKGLRRFSSLKTSSFRLSRNRSTFRSSNIDSEMKIPDEKPEPPRDTLSPEIRMNEYMRKQKYSLGESVTESGDHFTYEPSTSLKKVKFSDSIAETTEHLPVVNGQANGVAVIVTKAEEVAGSDHNHVDENHHDPVSTSEDATSSSSSKQDQTLVGEDDPPQGDSLDNSLDTQQLEDRQNTEQNTSL